MHVRQFERPIEGGRDSLNQTVLARGIGTNLTFDSRRVLTPNVSYGDRSEGRGRDRKVVALLHVEVMKMEYNLLAPVDGRIGETLTIAGKRVPVEAPLVRIAATTMTAE
jgi:pyruvate carboxylase